MIEPFIKYIRTLRFTGPDIEKRYYRIFGDLEYDLLALRTETAVMELRIREVKRRVMSCVRISTEDERQISATSHELNEHLYTRLERLHARITSARSFRYDYGSEQQGYYLFYDIATAIIGLHDTTLRKQEQPTLDDARIAYEQLDISWLLDLHDNVQPLLAQERREEPEAGEMEIWEDKLNELIARHPLRHAPVLDTPDGISGRLDVLKQQIARQQERLEYAGMVYTAAVGAMRFRN